MQEVISKILFNNVTLVSAADDEVVDAEVRIGLENVPKNWLATDLNHRLGL